MSEYHKNIRLSGVTLRVNSLEKMLKFYCSDLGLQILSGDAHHAELGTNGEPLVILERDEDASPLPYAAGLFHMAFLYPDRGALGTALRRLAERKKAIDGMADHGVSEAIYLSDPEGNGIELYVDRPTLLWPRKNGQIEMFTAALDLDGLLSLAETPGYHYRMPEATILGHLHLRVTDLKEAEEFYHGKLGLAVQQSSFPGALFFGKDGYHHHIGANVWGGRQPYQTGTRGLAGFTMEFLNGEKTLGENSSDVTDPSGIPVKIVTAREVAGLARSGRGG